MRISDWSSDVCSSDLPARAEIPAAGGPGAQVAVDLVRRSCRLLRGDDVFAIRLLARRVAVIPVAIEQRAVVQPQTMAARLSETQFIGAFHPERIFLAALRQLMQLPPDALGLQQPDHPTPNRRPGRG